MKVPAGDVARALQERLTAQVSEKEITLWKSLKERVLGEGGWKMPAFAFGVPFGLVSVPTLLSLGEIVPPAPSRLGVAMNSLYSNSGPATPMATLGHAAGMVAIGGAILLAGAIAEHDETKVEPVRINQRLFDSPEVQGILKAVAEKATEAEDVLAAKRGSVWIVVQPGQEPIVLNQQEYEARKKTDWPNLDEVRIDTDKVTVMRYTDGKLDAGVDRVVPAMEIFPISQGTLDVANKRDGFFAAGRKVSVDFLTERKARLSDDADMSVPGGLALA